MRQEHQRWYSPALGRDMDLLVFGHAGAKLLVFPTSLGTFREWYDRRMHHVLGDQIENGWLQMYCLHHVHDESWYDKQAHPGARAWRQLQYDQYLRDEVIPFTIRRNQRLRHHRGAGLGATTPQCFGFRNRTS
jgi:esterase/lipase superfamily enzyme